MKVAIDAGHSYTTAGKRSAPFLKNVTHTYEGYTVSVKKGEQFREHVANSGVCFYLEKELSRCGIDIVKSAWDDINGVNDTAIIDIATRQAKIKAAKCDYEISIHFNASGDGKSFNTGKGSATYYHSKAEKVKDGKKMADYIQKAIAADFPTQKNRGIKAGNLGMCSGTALGVKAAVLCELAFMTNQEEAETLFCNPKAWHDYAVAIAKGFCNYVGLKYTSAEEKEEENKKAAEVKTEQTTAEPQEFPAHIVYRVQVGSFTKYDNALNLQDALRKAGFESIIVKNAL